MPALERVFSALPRRLDAAIESLLRRAHGGLRADPVMALPVKIQVEFPNNIPVTVLVHARF